MGEDLGESNIYMTMPTLTSRTHFWAMRGCREKTHEACGPKWQYFASKVRCYKMCVVIESHAVVHSWNCVILLDFHNKLYAGTELHVVVHAWNYVILLDSNNKMCAGTAMHVNVSYRFVLSVANQCSILNYDVYIELAFDVKLLLSAANHVFTVELWCLQQISVHCRIVLSAANQCSLLNYNVCSELAFVAKLCCLQWTSDRCRVTVSATN